VGSALGLQSQLGQNLGTIYQPDRQTPYYTRWEFSVQRDLGLGFVAAATYLGSRGSSLPVVQSVNNIPIQYLSTSRTRDNAVETALTQAVANPFIGLSPGSATNTAATVQKMQLLRPYPEFGTFAIEKYVGSDRYSALTLQLDKRFRSGNSFTMQYTHSSLRDKMNYLNPADGQLEDRVSPNDRPNRFSIGGACGCRSDAKRSGAASGTARRMRWRRLAGERTYQYQSGFPLTFTNNIYWDASCGIRARSSRTSARRPAASPDSTCRAGTPVLLLPRRGGPDQRRGRPGEAAHRPAHQPEQQRALLPSTLPDVRSDNLH
jgi:hypothetical protein